MAHAAITPGRAEELLNALGEQLQTRGVQFELVVIGGTALGVLGLISRPTRDIDVVALIEGDEFIVADPLPRDLREAARTVAADFDLPGNWFNAEPSSDLVRLGLPIGFDERLVSRSYGPALRVHFADRVDQIHLKLYAMTDRGLGRHQEDLQALAPTTEELIAAARWARTHDPSEGFRDELIRVLRYLGVPDADVD